MKRTFDTIDNLDGYIEKVVRRTVKHYYTDWKNIDRPLYMKYKGSNRRQDKELLLIARECGTYLYTITDLEREYPAAVATYYAENAKYYFIDIAKLTARTATAAEVAAIVKETMKKAEEKRTA